MSDLRLHDLTLPNGLVLPVAEHGDAGGLPVLLLHGNTDTWRSWEPVLPLLPQGLRAVALTQRGHGGASKPAEGYAPADFAADAVAALDALGIGRAVLCGHSFGGLVALRAALDHPDRVAGLVLAGAFPGMKGNAAIEAFWDSDIRHMDGPLSLDFTCAFQAGCVARAPAPPIVEVAAQESLLCPGRVFRDSVRAAMALDLRPDLPRLRAAALLIWGEADGFVAREDQEAMARAIPGARLLAYAGTGHSVHWEEPRRFARDLAALAAACRPRAAAAA